MIEPKFPLEGVVWIADDTWELTSDRLYQTANGPVIVWRGFRTDLASIPRVLWRWLPPWGDYDNAAILHDYLYQSARFPRQIADQCLYDQMKLDGVSWWQRNIIYHAVRLFGWRFYHDD